MRRARRASPPDCSQPWRNAENKESPAPIVLTTGRVWTAGTICGRLPARGEQGTGCAQTDNLDSGIVAAADRLDPGFRPFRQAFVAAKQNVGGGHKVAVEIVVHIGDGVHVGGDRSAEPLGDRQQAAGKVDVTENAEVAGGCQVLEAFTGKGTFLDIL